MPIRSHVDLCLYTRFLHYRSGDLDPQTNNLLIDGNEREAWVKQFNHDLGLSFHEAYHYWQGLRLPFLHRYAILTMRVVTQAFQKLNKIPDLHAWDCMLPELYRLTLPSRWYSPKQGQVYVTRLSNGTREGIDLTCLDLLEGAATVAQWQTTVAQGDARTSWLSFSRWTKRNPSYASAIKAVAHAVDDSDLAIRCFLPMVNTAFHTSEPVLALGILTTLLNSPEVKPWIDHSEPCNWREFFTRALNIMPFKDKADCDRKILGSPFHEITTNWIGSSLKHPMLSDPAMKWLALEKNGTEFTMMLDQPGYVDGDKIAETMRDFSPLTIACFHLSEQKNHIVITASGDTDEGVAMDHGYFWLQSLLLYSVVRRAAGVHFDPDARLCYHKDCPEYKYNYCNAFVSVPDSYQECKFPKMVEQFRVDFNTHVKEKTYD